MDAGGPAAAQARLRDLAEAVAAALREARLDGLVSQVDEQSVGALLALRAEPARAGEQRANGGEDAALAALAAGVRRGRDGLVIAAGSGVDSPREARRSLLEARQVADAARHDPRPVPVFRLPHVGVVGLLQLLRDEPRLQLFVERELGPLLAHDAAHPRDQLLGSLRAYLDSGPEQVGRRGRGAPVPPGVLRTVGADRGGFSAPTSTRSRRACRCMSRCSRWTRSATGAVSDPADSGAGDRRTGQPSNLPVRTVVDEFLPGICGKGEHRTAAILGVADLYGPAPHRRTSTQEPLVLLRLLLRHSPSSTDTAAPPRRIRSALRSPARSEYGNRKG